MFPSPEGETSVNCKEPLLTASHQQLLYHIVFSTKERRPLLRDNDFRNSVWSYMAGVASNLEGHALRIGGYFDHAHILVRIPAKIAVDQNPVAHATDRDVSPYGLTESIPTFRESS